MSFVNNTGGNGAAVSLQGLSYINVNLSHLEFTNNKATRGGAIYAKLVVEATVISAASCFIQSDKNEPPSKWNSTLTFRGNVAERGHSIFTTSLPYPVKLPTESSNIK